MLKTYTFFLRDGGDPVRFKPELCRSDLAALRRARVLLHEHSECETVEVFFGDDCLFTIERTPT